MSQEVAVAVKSGSALPVNAKTRERTIAKDFSQAANTVHHGLAI